MGKTIWNIGLILIVAVTAGFFGAYLSTGKYAPHEIPVVSEQGDDLVDERLQEQHAIIAKLDSAQREIEALKKEIEKLRRQLRPLEQLAKIQEAKLATLTSATIQPITHTVTTMREAERIKKDALRTFGPLGLSRIELVRR